MPPDCAGATIRMQLLVNDEIESLQMHNMSQFLLDASQAEPFLHATELDAQRAEQIINLELNPIP